MIDLKNRAVSFLDRILSFAAGAALAWVAYGFLV
jgi:hypothetical protein